jgi:hypothetical protein
MVINYFMNDVVVALNRSILGPVLNERIGQ